MAKLILVIFFFQSDMAFGDIKHTGMHNRFGGYENDCSVARLSENRFMLMSPSIQQMKSYAWMRHHLPSDGSVYLEDVTSLYTTLVSTHSMFL